MDQADAPSPPSGIYLQALNKIRQGLCAFDHEQRLLLFNRQYAEMYGIAPEALKLGMSLRDVVDLRYAAGTGPTMAREEYAIWRDQIAIADKVVETIVELQNGRVHEIHHEPTANGGWVATFDDITERRQREALLRHMASHDALTGLLNRHAFEERLEQALAKAIDGDRIAVLCLDLDRFKPVNDTYGHNVGDLLLRSVADRIRAQIHDGDSAVRLGGDEFCILQTSLRHPSDAEQLAVRIISSVAQPYAIEGHSIDIGLSVGIALAPIDGLSAEALLKCADAALYNAKRLGNGLCRFFDASTDSRRPRNSYCVKSRSISEPTQASV